MNLQILIMAVIISKTDMSKNTNQVLGKCPFSNILLNKLSKVGPKTFLPFIKKNH